MTFHFHRRETCFGTSILPLPDVEITGFYPILPPNSCHKLSVSLMKSTALLVVLAATGLLVACSSTRDELSKSATNNHAPVAHNTIVDCPVYDGMKKTSVVLAQTTASNEVQVTDTINAYFVRVRLDKEGKTLIGYMDRRCFGEQGNK